MDIKGITLSTDQKDYFAFVGNKAYKINSYFYDIILRMKEGLTFEQAIAEVSTNRSVDSAILMTKFKRLLDYMDKANAQANYIHYRRTIIEESITNKICNVLKIFFPPI